MKRRNFLKAFTAACAAPVVIAKAVAAHRDNSILLSNGSTIRLRRHTNCDNMIRGMKDYKPLVEQMWGPPTETYKSAFGDVEIYKHPSAH